MRMEINCRNCRKALERCARRISKFHESGFRAEATRRSNGTNENLLPSRSVTFFRRSYKQPRPTCAIFLPAKSCQASPPSTKRRSTGSTRDLQTSSSFLSRPVFSRPELTAINHPTTFTLASARSTFPSRNSSTHTLSAYEFARIRNLVGIFNKRGRFVAFRDVLPGKRATLSYSSTIQRSQANDEAGKRMGQG